MNEKRGWLDRLIDNLVRTQGSIIPQVPTNVRWQGRDRKARLTISGNPSTVRYFRWTGRELIEEDSPKGIRNTIQMHVDTLIDIGEGALSPREAVAAGLVSISGDRSLYDREEVISLFEDIIGARVREIFTR